MKEVQAARNLPKVYLTFDVEDFINESSVYSLNSILRMLRRLNMKAIFFITGHMTEKIAKYPRIIDLLNEHQIGFHSSGHSVRPTIFEYTDIQDFHEAYKVSLIRETSLINPLTGEIEGEGGGLSLLRQVFPDKNICSFRAPGLCWSPSNLMALFDLKIGYDFSTEISLDAFKHRGITFFPAPVPLDSIGPRRSRRILNAATKRPTTVLLVHPSSLGNSEYWDSKYFDGNPNRLSSVLQRSLRDRINRFAKLELFLLSLKTMHQAGLIVITSDLRDQPIAYEKIKNQLDPAKIYEKTMFWTKYFHYRPRYLYDHFLEFLR
jgi:peptidoglycan/xylan/chitin deacetylase (PgdA/CDA1 family)